MKPIKPKTTIHVLVFFIILMFQKLPPLNAQNNIDIGGAINGKTYWNYDTVKVTDDLIIDTLIIAPGTVVEMQGNYYIKIKHSLEALGTVNDTIFFTINDTTGFSDPDSQDGGWQGIYITGNEVDFSLKLCYCKLQYSKKSGIDGFLEVSGIMEIKHSIIQNNLLNGISVFGGMKAKICTSEISNNRGNGIFVTWVANATIYSCIIQKNSEDGINSKSDAGYRTEIKNSVIKCNKGYGINSKEDGITVVRNNVIKANLKGGVNIESQKRNAVIENNKIKQNQGIGLRLNDGVFYVYNNLIFENDDAGISLVTSARLINNLIFNNGGGILIGLGVPLQIYNCIIRESFFENGKPFKSIIDETINGEIVYSNVETFTAEDIDGDFINNIDTDPLFVDETNYDFNLSDFSPCINAGTPDTNGLYLPETDASYNARIVDGRIDMGPYEYQQDNFHILKQPTNKLVCNGERMQLETDAWGDITGYQWEKNGETITGATDKIFLIEKAKLSDNGDYNCIITAEDKIVSTDIAEVIVNSLPDINLPKDTTISTEQTLEINAGSGYETYLWSNGFDDQILILTDLPVGHYKYTITVSDINNCFNEDSINVTVELLNNIKKISYSDILIFPNPLNTTLFIKTVNTIDNVVITIIDNNGTILMIRTFSNFFSDEVYSFDVSYLPDGIYYLHIKNDEEDMIKKIVLKK